MANHKSARKRARQNLKRRARNRQYISSVRTAVKTLQAAIDDGQGMDKVQGLFNSAQSLLAKAAAKGLLHKNNASRRIGRLANALKDVAPTTKAAATTSKKTKVKKATKKKAATKKKSAAKKKAAAKKKKTKKKTTKKKKR